MIGEFGEKLPLDHALAEALVRDPAIFTRPDSGQAEDLRFGFERITRFLHGDLLRGQDFLEMEESSLEARRWLALPEHVYLQQLGMKMATSKKGRLGAVIATHPRREELVVLLTPEAISRFPEFEKTRPHISRLLTHEHAPACEALVFDILSHLERCGDIPYSLDGTESFIFWTYMPYVLEQVKGRGRSYLDVMSAWAAKREPIATQPGDARYPGIEYLYDRDSFFHYLSKDGEDPSHKFVKFMVERAIIPNIKWES